MRRWDHESLCGDDDHRGNPATFTRDKLLEASGGVKYGSRKPDDAVRSNTNKRGLNHERRTFWTLAKRNFHLPWYCLQLYHGGYCIGVGSYRRGTRMALVSLGLSGQG